VQPVEDDGLAFDASSVKVTEIRDTQEYGGFRVLLTARLGTAILRLQIDVGFGDAITPTPAITEFPSWIFATRISSASESLVKSTSLHCPYSFLPWAPRLVYRLRFPGGLSANMLNP
jgi:hypothetical protein